MHFAWDSTFIIVCFVLSGLLWIVFFVWEWYANRKMSHFELMFPWRFVYNRVSMAALL